MTGTEANLILSYIHLREIVRDVIADMNDASQATEGASIEEVLDWAHTLQEGLRIWSEQ